MSSPTEQVHSKMKNNNLTQVAVSLYFTSLKTCMPQASFLFSFFVHTWGPFSFQTLSFSIKSHLTQQGLGESWRQSWLWRLWRLLSRWWLLCVQEPLLTVNLWFIPNTVSLRFYDYVLKRVSANNTACSWCMSAKESTTVDCFSASMLWKRTC